MRLFLPWTLGAFVIQGCALSPDALGGSPARLREDRGTAILLVLDTSGSMAGGNLALAKRAILESANILRTEDAIAILSFDTQPHWTLPFTKDEKEERIRQALDPVKAKGGSDIYVALRDALARFHHDVSGRSAEKKHLILISDGDTKPQNIEEAVSRLREAGVSVSTIGLYSRGHDPLLMKKIADWGGGRFTFTGESSGRPRIVANEIAQVLK